MKLISEYLEHAVQFERLANAERDFTFKAMMMDQAKRYRELAKLRIDRLNLVFVEQQKNST